MSAATAERSSIVPALFCRVCERRHLKRICRAADRQDVKRGWLLAVLAALVGASVVLLLPSTRPSENAPRELHACAALSLIYLRQGEFVGQTHRCGSLRDLTESKYLDASFLPGEGAAVLRRDYHIRIDVAGSGAVWPIGMWCAYAWPAASRGAYRTYVIWANSFIYATCDAYEGTTGPTFDAAFPAGADEHQPQSYVGRDGREWVHVG
jgi:hypothetical protein